MPKSMHVTRSAFMVVVLAAVACIVYLRLVVPAREAERSMTCQNNLKQLTLALVNYENAYRALPPAVTISPDGRLWRSWRSHIYPKFVKASSMFYDEHSSWDSPTNIRLLDGTQIPFYDKAGNVSMQKLERLPKAFCCPSTRSQHGHGINYVVVTGQLTAFPKSEAVKLSDITDGLENTILVVESVTCLPDWTEPRDLEFDKMSFRINPRNENGISSHHPLGPWVCFADLATFRLTEKVTESELRAMLTIRGNEGITRRELIDRGALIGH